jgi:hypothetical protein
MKYKSDEEFSDRSHSSTVDPLPACMSASHISSSCVSSTVYAVGIYSYLTAYTVLRQVDTDEAKDMDLRFGL